MISSKRQSAEKNVHHGQTIGSVLTKLSAAVVTRYSNSWVGRMARTHPDHCPFEGLTCSPQTEMPGPVRPQAQMKSDLAPA